MRKQPQNPYHFMDDPHLYYFIQSPTRINQLLISGKYYMDKDRLFEVGSNKSVKVDEYVMHRIVIPEHRQLSPTSSLGELKKLQKENKCRNISKPIRNKKVSPSHSQLPPIKGLAQFKNKII